MAAGVKHGNGEGGGMTLLLLPTGDHGKLTQTMTPHLGMPNSYLLQSPVSRMLGIC